MSQLESSELKLYFADLLLDYMDAKNLTPGRFTVRTGFNRQMYNQITRLDILHIPNKQTLKTICVGMGFNLLLTQVAMYVAGSNLSSAVLADKVYVDFLKSGTYKMSFANQHDVAGLTRITECNEYMSIHGGKKALLLKDPVTS